MTYKAVFTDEFLSYFRLDDNGKTLVLTDKTGLTRAVTLESERHGEWIKEDFKMICPFCDTYFSTINTPINVFMGFYHFCPYCGADLRKRGEIE